MPRYDTMNTDQLRAEQAHLQQEYAAYKAAGLKLNMARGRPSTEQLNLSNPLLDMLNSSSDFISEEGIDVRNYGTTTGLTEAKRLMACMVDEDPEHVVVGGVSSLNLMYNTVAQFLDFGCLGSKPWSQYDGIKWICPCPGYDRHFQICETFGIKMIPVAMTPDGPDMDEVERIAASDERVKGIWCVPKYSNPTGVTFSDATVRRLASMTCAADDFRIFWDNAYGVHHLHNTPECQDKLLDLGAACVEAGNPHRYVKFASTSKVTFAGGGISAMAASQEAIDEVTSHLSIQTIGYDKINQLRHVRFLKDAAGIASHMEKHAALLRPKFETVDERLTAGLSEAGIGTWTKPRGGYFISFEAPLGCAKRSVELAREAGVIMTSAGATWPYGKDPQDTNVRIAPSLPPVAELAQAMDVFTCCVKLAYLERVLG
ncbi:MAG: aminotransferase class I/II-fold pyridoxal phosphate-dependent enzyme [Coriobacteriia bacterium]|nr:aminotransferase class I/II-fold pyridoxal phosphate-dependent enzyme [Coriobacteriia bacterium]